MVASVECLRPNAYVTILESIGIDVDTFRWEDGMFFTPHLYDGQLININARTSTGSTQILAFAWIPAESADHLAWVILQMHAAGFPIELVPFLSDRGHLIAASVVLKEFHDLVIILFFCLEHILGNINDKFSIEKNQYQVLRGFVFQLQCSPRSMSSALQHGILFAALDNLVWRLLYI